MSIVDNLNKRVSTNVDSVNRYYSTSSSLSTRIERRGGPDQRIRMRQDKLNSLKKAILYSYQSAIVQQYNTDYETLINDLQDILLKFQNQQILLPQDEQFLTKIENQYNISSFIERGTPEYEEALTGIIKEHTTPLFRCLINHDKLKVQYEDKIISIPFMEKPVGGMQEVETNFHNGTVFKWVHGNKEQWTPDTYWIVYMQYSEETAYFRAEIRKADNEIQIIMINQDGSESTKLYRGWMTGPNETQIVWNIKKNITWNDMNYTKILYITKDENTLAFFKRFDKVIINGDPWEVQAYNESYTTSKSGDQESGIIRVALKETYTNTDNFVKETLEQIEANQNKDDGIEEPHIIGSSVAKPYSILVYQAKNFNESLQWQIDSPLAVIKQISQDGLKATVEIVTGKSNQEGFDVKYGDSILHVTIKSL